MGGQRPLRWCLLLFLWLAFPASAADQIVFDIEPQSADRALVEFARQAHVSVLLPAGQFSQISTNALHGRYDVRRALGILLRDTGLVAELGATGSISVKSFNSLGDTDLNNTKRRNWFGTLLSALGVALSAAPVAHGQTAGLFQLEEVIVTAEKRTVNIQDAPAAITAYSGEELVHMGVDSIDQMSMNFPSSRFETTGYATHLYVRGIGAEQDRISVDQLVNMTYDGMMLPREMSASGLFDLNDLELLPGPQGTLYGASSVGGVIVISGRRPNHTNENRLSVDVGNYGTFRVSDAQNFDVSNQLAVRAAVNYKRHGPYLTSGHWTENTFAARLGVLYEPSERFSAYVWGLTSSNDSIPLEGGNLDFDGNWISGSPWDTTSCLVKTCNGAADYPVGTADGKFRDYIVAGQFDWHLGNITISDIPGVLDNNMFTSKFGRTGNQIYIVHNHQVSNELRISNDSKSKAQWLTGLYYYKNDASQSLTTGNFVLPKFTVEGIAPFGQMIYSFRDNFRGVAGLRYSSTTKEGDFVGPSDLAPTKGTWSNVDWKLGVERDVGADAMAYVTIQTGTSPGTLDAQNPTPVVAPVPTSRKATVTDITTLKSLTVGWKSELLDRRVQFNNELFYYDYTDFLIQTVSCNLPGGFCLANQTVNVFLSAPSLITWGAQLDTKWRITEADQVSLNAAYTHQRTGDWITNLGADLSNQTLFEVPAFTASIGYQHVFPTAKGGETVLRVDSAWSSSYYFDFETRSDYPVHIPRAKQDPFSKTNLNLTYHSPGDTWTLGLYLQNLENDAQKGPGGAGSPFPQPYGSPNGVIAASTGIVNAPRNWGLRYTAHFN